MSHSLEGRKIILDDDDSLKLFRAVTLGLPPRIKIKVIPL